MSWTDAYLFHYSTCFVYCTLPVSVLVTYIMHIVHAVRSLQAPGVTSLRLTSRLKTVQGYTWAVSLSGSVPEWISTHSSWQLCPQQGTCEEEQSGLPKSAEAITVFPFCSSSRKQLNRSAAALSRVIVLRWAGATHFSFVTLVELHWQRSSRAEAFHGNTLEIPTRASEAVLLALGNSVACHVSNFLSECWGEYFLVGAMRGKRGVPYRAMPCKHRAVQTEQTVIIS